MADRFMVDRLMGTLTMKKVEENDSGPYTCIAKNSAGENESTVNVEVINYLSCNPYFIFFKKKLLILGDCKAKDHFA